MSVFTQWLTRLRQMISNASQPEPVPVTQGQPLPLLPRLYSEEQVKTIRLEERQHGKAEAYAEMAGNTQNLYWWRQGKRTVTDKLQKILVLQETPEMKLLIIRDQCVTTEGYAHNQQAYPYAHQGDDWERYRQEHDPFLRPTEQMKAAAKEQPNWLHATRLDRMTIGHAAMPTEPGDAFTIE